MGYQREGWHSGLTYEQICETCQTVVRYTDYSLGFRPWYADGYVDCPKCKSHLRHNEKYAIDAPQSPTVIEAEATAAPVSGNFTDVYCSGCGRKFGDGHQFCTACGSKRH